MHIFVGAAAVMKRANPHLINVHCVAHKLALCTSQAAENIPQLKDHQETLTQLFKYFKFSSKRADKMRKIQEILDGPVLKYKEVYSVRWLSYYEALSAVHRTLASLLTYFAQSGDNDPKAIGLKRKIASEKFIGITYLMMDAMKPITTLSKFFQTENVDVALIGIKIDQCLAELQKVKDMTSPNLQMLRQDLPQNGSFKGEHQVSKSVFNLENTTVKFIDSVTKNIQSRFPSTDLLRALAVLAMRPISHLDNEEQNEYGNQEIDVLCAHFGEQKKHSMGRKWNPQAKHTRSNN